MIARPFEPGDDDAVVALFARLRADEPSMDPMDLERWRAFRSFSIFADGRDFRVVPTEGGVGALLTVGKLEPRGKAPWRVRVYVDPPMRRRGIASRLLRGCEEAARAEGAPSFEGFIQGSWVAGRAFAEARGFSLLVRDLFLSRGLEPFDAAAPRGVILRAWVPGADDEAWAAVANATLARDVGFHPETPASLVGYARSPGFFLWVAESEGELVGFCHVDRRGDVGYVQAIGVLASHEGRGVGAALLSRGIGTLRGSGVARIELCTEENNARAQRLYARAGFTLHHDGLSLRKALGLG